MFIYCDICGKKIEIDRKKFKRFIYPNEPFACSKKCILIWIQRQKKQIWKGVRIASSDSREFRSDYEVRVSLFLTENKIRWEYEAYGFRVQGGSYTPDFYLSDYGVFLEVKGRPAIGSRKKMLRFREKYPEVNLLMITWLIKGEFYEKNLGNV